MEHVRSTSGDREELAAAPGRPLRAAVSGSYRSDLPGLMAKRDELAASGIEILFPESTVADGADDDFVFLATDRSRDPRHLQARNLHLIERCDFLYVYNPGGRVGLSTALEVGYALKAGVPVLSLERVDDATLSRFVLPVPDIGALRGLLGGTTLRDLQRFCGHFVRDKGFDEEGASDLMLLLQEEIGELARQVRQASGLKAAAGARADREALAEEVADCVKYLLIIANHFDIDLQSAFLRKQAADVGRDWAPA